jgi:dTDP-glucose pyrophosphorylase
VDSNWQVTRIIEKPKPEEIMSPFAASILFLFPPQIWDYVSKLEPSARGEIEMQAAVQNMIEDGYNAYGVLQPIPEEWDAALHLTPRT